MRSAFMADRLAPYQDLIALLIERAGSSEVVASGPDGSGPISQIFHAVERARSRSLLDIMQGSLEVLERVSESSDDPSEKRLLQEMLALRGELNDLYARIDRSGSAPDSQWRSQVAEVERRLDACETRLASTRGAGGLFAEPAQVHDVAAILPRDAALVEFGVANGHVIALLMRGREIHLFPDLVELDQLHEKIEAALFQISRAIGYAAQGEHVGEEMIRDAQEEFAALHLALLDPLMNALQGAERLIIVPHGRLHALPFAALHDGHSYLAERFAITMSPSASVLMHLHHMHQSEASSPPSESLLVGLADAAAPFIADEIQMLRALLRNVRVLEGDAATRAALQSAARAAGLIHLACHARFLASAPSSSGLRLADGWLTVRDLYGWRLNQPLVTLSGCDTGGASVSAGDELEGLARAFLAAGASTLLVSLWPLHDESALNLLALVHDVWHNKDAADTRGLAKSLQHAQLQLLRQRPHPALWSAFVLYGGI